VLADLESLTGLNVSNPSGALIVGRFQCGQSYTVNQLNFFLIRRATMILSVGRLPKSMRPTQAQPSELRLLFPTLARLSVAQAVRKRSVQALQRLSEPLSIASRDHTLVERLLWTLLTHARHLILFAEQLYQS
jgi:hypothetical protein